MGTVTRTYSVGGKRVTETYGGSSSSGGGSSSSSSQSSPSSSKISSLNTYDASTKTYTDWSGNKYSMSSAPKGASVVNKFTGSSSKSPSVSSGGSGGGTITTKEVAPKTLSIKSTDYMDESGKSVGGITIQGSKGGTGKVLSTDFSKQQTEALVKEKGYSSVEQNLKSSVSSSKYEQEAKTDLEKDRVSKNYLGDYSLGSFGLAGNLGLFYGSKARGEYSTKNDLSDSNIMGRNNFLLSYSPTFYLASKITKEDLGNAWNLAKSKTQVSIPIFIGAGGNIPLKDITGTFGEVAKETSQGIYEKKEEEFNIKYSPFINKENEFTGTEKQYQSYLSERESLINLKSSALSDWAGGIKYTIFSGASKLPTSYVEWGAITGAVWAGGAVLGGLGSWGSTLPKGFQVAGKIVSYGLDTSMVYFGGKTAFNKDLMPSQRIAGGVFAGLGIFNLGIKTYKGISTALGYPKTTTKVLGTTQNLKANKVTTDIFYKTNVKNLVGTKDYYGFSRSVSYTGKSGNIQYAKTLTGGYYAKYKGVDLVTGKNIFGKGTFYGAGSISLSQKAGVIFQDINKINYMKEGVEGFAQVNLGLVSTKKGSNYFAGVGGGMQKGKFTEIFGATGNVAKGNILKSGRGSYSGLIIKKSEDISSGVSFIQSGGAKSSSNFLNQLYGSAVQSSQSPIVHAIKNTPVSMPKIITTGMLPTISAQSIQENYPSYVGGTGTQKYDQLEFSKIDTSLGLSPIQKLTQRARGKQGGGSAQFSGQIPGQAQIIAPIQIQPPTQTPRITQRQITRIQPPSVPSIPTPYIPNPRTFFPNFKFGFADTQLGKRRIKVKKIVAYTPSYSALVFGIRGKAPKGIETGLRIRPITKGFSFANLFSKRKIRVKKVKRRKK